MRNTDIPQFTLGNLEQKSVHNFSLNHQMKIERSTFYFYRSDLKQAFKFCIINFTSTQSLHEFQDN